MSLPPRHPAGRDGHGIGLCIRDARHAAPGGPPE
jgi:hypothetical protein